MTGSVTKSFREDPVVITGTGMVSSLGLGASETWEALLLGRDGIRPIEGFDAGGFDCRMAAQIHGLDPTELVIQPNWERIMDLHSYMLMRCAHDAFKQAHLDTASIPGEKIGFFVGMGMVDYKVEDLLPAVLASMNDGGALDIDAFYSDGYQEVHPLALLSMLNNISVCQVAISLNIRGENTIFSPHADSGAQAIAEGMMTLLDGKAKIVLAGGVSEKVCPSALARAHLGGVLNTSSGHEEMPCCPLATDRKGTILGEGCGVLALELRSSAEERGAPFTGMITGYGAAFQIDEESHGPTATAIARSMEEALRCADLSPSDMDVVIAHGDGTIGGDKNEIEALNQVFPGCRDKIHVYSSKGSLGHLLAGAPAVDAILGVHMVNDGMIPATFPPVSPDGNLNIGTVGEQPLKVSIRRVMVNCRSFEGQCASLIIEGVG